MDSSNKDANIGRLELGALVYNCVLIGLFVGYPEISIQYGGAAGWICTLLSGLMFLAFLYIFLNIKQWCNKKTSNIQQNPNSRNKCQKDKNLPSLVKNAVAVMLCLCFATVVTVCFIDKLNSVWCFEFSKLFIGVIVIGAVAFIAKNGIKAVRRIHSLSIIPIGAAIVFITVLNLRRGEIYNLVPITGKGGISILKGACLGMWQYAGIIPMLFTWDRDVSASYKKIVIKAGTMGVLTNVLCVTVLSLNFCSEVAESISPILGFLSKRASLGNLSAHPDLLYQNALITSVVLYLSMLARLMTDCAKNFIRTVKEDLSECYVSCIKCKDENKKDVNIDNNSFKINDLNKMSLKNSNKIPKSLKIGFKKILLIFSVVYGLTLFCGCAGGTEPEQNAYVIAIGIDNVRDNTAETADNGENINSNKEGNYVFTFQISNPLNMGGTINKEDINKEDKDSYISEKEDDKSKNKTVDNITITAKNLQGAVDKLQSIMSKNVNLTHLKLAVFSTESAKNAVDIGNSEKVGYANKISIVSDMFKISTELFKRKDVRPTINLCIADNAKEYLININPTLEKSTVGYIELYFGNPKVPYAPISTLDQYINKSVDDSCGAVVPIVTDKGLCGMGIFKSGVLVNIGDNNQASAYKILEGSMHGMADDETGLVIYSTKPCEISVNYDKNLIGSNDYDENYDYQDLKLKVSVKLNIRLDGAENLGFKRIFDGFMQSEDDDKADNYDEMSALTKSKIRNNVTEMLNDGYNSGCDILGISKRLKGDFLTEKDWRDFDFWDKVKSKEIYTEFSIVFAD